MAGVNYRLPTVAELKQQLAAANARVKTVEAENAALRSQIEWQLIENCPEEKTVILLPKNGDAPYMCYVPKWLIKQVKKRCSHFIYNKNFDCWNKKSEAVEDAAIYDAAESIENQVREDL